MGKYFIFSLFIFVFCGQVTAQIHPAENSKLHYRIIGFSFPVGVEGSRYRLEIAEGTTNDDKEFASHKITSVESTTSKIVAEVPNFASDYTWRVVYQKDGKSVPEIGFHHFRTRKFDTDNVRMRITQKAKAYQDAFIFVDCAKALYDMSGRPVWFIPTFQLPDVEQEAVMDLKFTSAGTITFLLVNGSAYELNYAGDVLWALKKDTIDFEPNHHEFTRLNNGNYMLLQNEQVHWLLPGRSEMPPATNAVDSLARYQEMAFGKVVEYDKKGKVVWTWMSSKHFEHSDISHRLTSDGTYDADAHLNAFFFDEETSSIYLSFKNINRILRIKYPEGNVLNSYGPTYSKDTPDLYNELFCAQHGCKISRKENLYMFNNNSCTKGGMPKLVMFDKCIEGNNTLKKIWEYTCTIDDPILLRKPTEPFAKGGNIVEIDKDAFFASMSLPYSKMFIVNMQKEVLWSTVVESWNESETHWEIPALYRASFIKRGVFEEMIFN